MENLTVEALEQVLPPDKLQQNEVLKKLVLTLRQKLNNALAELQTTKDQLCIACTKRESQAPHSDDSLTKKELAAAVAKVASIQADYDALVAHFANVRDKHQQIIQDLDNQRKLNDQLRGRNAELIKQLQTQQVDLSRFNELQVLLTNCQIEMQKLEESQAKAYAASIDQAQKLQLVQK